MSAFSLLLLLLLTATMSLRMTAGFEEDEYLSSRRVACEDSSSNRGSRALACLEYRALAWLREVAGSSLELDMGLARLLPLASSSPSPSRELALELEEKGALPGGAVGFALHQLRRFASSHALLVPVGVNGDLPAVVDQDQLPSALTPGAAEPRGKKKKKLALLLPLLFLLKLKLLLVPALLTVLFIKKLLVVAVLLAPTLYSMVRSCHSAPHHDHGPPPHYWDHASTSYHSGASGWDHGASSYHYGGGGGTGADWESSPPPGHAAHHDADFLPETYGSPHYHRRRLGAQAMAYKAHKTGAANVPGV